MKYSRFIDEWKKLYDDEGMSFREIERRYGVPAGTVNRTLYKHVKKRKPKFRQYADKMLDMYTQGYSKSDIAKKFGASPATVTLILKEKGVTPDDYGTKKYEKEAKKWAEQYKEGMSLREIAAQSGGVGIATIRDYVIEQGVNVRDISEATRQFSINEHYFDEVNSDIKAYHLGLAFGIGYVFEKYSSLFFGISFTQKTAETGEKLINALGQTTNFKVDEKITYRYASRHMANTLQGWGLHKKKEKNAVFPDLEENSAFVLGYWEGRGTCSKYQLRFTGSRMFLDELTKILGKIISEKYILLRYNKKADSYLLEVARQSNVKTVLRWMYQDYDFYSRSKFPEFLDTH